MSLIKGEWLDYALTIGMTAEEYWHADPSLIYNYERSFQNKKQLKEQELWLQGAYIRSALCSVIVPVGLADNRTHHNLPEYAPSPIPVDNTVENIDCDKEQERAGRYFDALMEFNNKRGRYER